MAHLFCFGAGYCALALARQRLASGWRVSGTSRSDEGLATLEQAGINPVRFASDFPLEDAPGTLGDVSHILVSVPPERDGDHAQPDPVLRLHRGDLAALAGGALAWVGYLSTTGVYGDRDGGQVDETSPLSPTGRRGAARVAAEQGWLALKQQAGLPVHVFRLAGIYGPGRNALETVRKGRARRIVKPGQVFSRIHRDDIVQVLQASMARPDPGAVYNLADDCPAPPQDVIAHACTLLGVEPPPEIPFEQAELSEMAKSFYADNKRVSNARIKADLGVDLLYPDYRAGLAAELARLAGR